MKQFTSEQIEARFEELPPEIQAAVTSTDVQEKIKTISDKYNLHIDQFGELVDEIGLVMLGLKKSANFVPDLVSRLSIDQKTAENISSDVSTDIFSAIRANLRQIEEKYDEASENTEQPDEEATGITNAETLAAIEDPETIKQAQPINALTALAQPENRTEPLVDYLLVNAIAQPTEHLEKTVSPSKNKLTLGKPAASSTPLILTTASPALSLSVPQKPAADPYHETI